MGRDDQCPVKNMYLQAISKLLQMYVSIAFKKKKKKKFTIFFRAAQSHFMFLFLVVFLSFKTSPHSLQLNSDTLFSFEAPEIYR